MALKALSKDEELAAIPSDQPVLVQLPEFVGIEEPEREEPATDGPNVLKEQLAAMQAANEIALKRERDQRVEAEGRADKAERERAAAVAAQADTESSAVSSGLSAAQSEQASAKQALKIAGESGDWDAIGEAQARIARAASDIREFERAAATLADDKGRQTEPTIVQPRIDVNTAIDRNPQLLDAEKVWLKAHPEAMIDPSRNKELDVAYLKATRKGISRGTPEYFRFIESEMGYSPPTQEDNGMSVSAPGTRADRGSDGRPTGGKITLSPEQREIAKNMGLTDIEYARQVAAFDVARKADPAKYGDR